MAQQAQQIVQQVKPVQPIKTTVTPSKSTGLSLMKNYNTDSDSDDSGVFAAFFLL